MKMVSLCLRGLDRSHIQAYPVAEDDIVRATTVSRFLKYMRSNWIEDFNDTAERNANYWFEKGVMVTLGGWEKKSVMSIERLELSELPEEAQEMLLVGDEDYQETVAEMLADKHGVPLKRTKKAVKDLVKNGSSKFAVEREEVNRPTVRACAPDGDVFYPSWIMDPQRSPYVFYRELATPQEVLGRVRSEDWDEAWADHVVTYCRGRGSQTNPGINNRNNIPNNPLSRFQSIDNGLIELVWMYQRLIDEETGAEGIYCTVFCPGYIPVLGR